VLLATDPARVAASVTNAACNLAAEPGADSESWLAAMEAAAPLCRDVDTCLKAGQVAAWRCGMAHYRRGALAIVPELPADLLAAALRLPDGVDASREAVVETLGDPWRPLASAGKEWRPAGLALVARTGGFRGFGGPFISPPEVFAKDGALFAFDSEVCWSLHADAFGVTFRRFGPELPKGTLEGGGSFTLDECGVARKGPLVGEFPVLRRSSSSASDGDTLAATLPRSHRIYLVAAVG